MPWHVEKSDSCPTSRPWAVIKDEDGTVEACHPNEESAERHMRALYANEPAAKSWFRVENRADRAAVYLYDEIGGFGVSASDFVAQLRDIDMDTIELHINSPGGAVFDGMAIYNAIANHPAQVRVVIDGIAASAASFIAMAGDEIVAEANATLMVHDGIGVAAGNAEDMRELATLLDKFSDGIAAIYANRAGGEPEEWRERMRATTWYTAAEAKDVGLVDRVTGRPNPRKREQATNKWDLSLFTHHTPAKPPDPVNQAEPDPPGEAGFLVPDIRAPLEALAEIPWDPDLFKAAVAVVANDYPAADTARPEPEVPEPEFTIRLPDLRRAIREGQL